ncbi:ras-related protein rab-5c [Anaeramoeba flamelloides]|uniref:Ras-related protein rab-5c n=1 Tax=Anaeramoeba flamelloides TaxID=1746091 RepID=A0AAV7ZH64_9EUKA|nr:ras-related protein rab-5c [Anaeramoeba flamelloides]
MSFQFLENSSEEADIYEQTVIKIVMLGQCGTGKTSIVNRFVKDQFDPEIKTTVGANFFLRSINVDGLNFCIRLWDTSGQERFNSLTPLYYRNSNIAILVYDIKDITSLEKVKYWIKEIHNNVKIMPFIVIVGNKMDQYDEKVDLKTLNLAKSVTEQIGADIMHTSAKTGEGITEMFENITRKVIKNRSKNVMQKVDSDITEKPMPEIKEVGKTETEKKTKCC